MPSKRNIQTVSNLKDKLLRSKSIVLADYKGLNVGQTNELKSELKKSGAEFQVAKNTLLKIAFKEVKLVSPDEVLVGATAILFCYEDEIAPIKALYEFFKKNELPKIKVGFLGKDPLTAEQVKSLAQLPDKLTLQAQVINRLKSPISGFVYVLKANLSKLVYVLEAIRKNKK